MPLGDGSKVAGYTIQRLLGSGGMGDVYLAHHPRLPREDALKILRSDISADPDFVERFNREADLAAKLWHPHIVGIHDRGKYRERLWISMDFVDGTDVSRLLEEQYPNGMRAEDAIEIVKAVAAALDHAHAKGLLHRDVKPANILISDAGDGERRILLGDFGVARDLADNTNRGLTATNMTVGTAAYAAPEQLMGMSLDRRDDQYSLAATAYHLLAGAPPFQHSNPAVVIGQHLNSMPPALADARPELASLDEVLLRALAKDPNSRFATCTDFARALDDASQGKVAATPSLSDADTMLRVAAPAPASAEPSDLQHSHPTEGRVRGKLLALAAAAIVTVIGLVAYFAVARGDDPPPSEPFTLAGTLRLSSDAIKTTGLPNGYKCAGTRDYGDVGPKAPVTVEDESGELLAKGAIESSNSGSDSCSLKFRVDQVPSGARFYRVQIAQHPEMSYTESEAKAGIEIALGDSEPSPSTATAAPPSKPLPPPPPSTQTRTVTMTSDREQASLNRLRAIASDDQPYVAAVLADRWIPQISSKRVRLEAEGTVWDNEQILDEHLRLRQMYPDVRLLWSGDWSTFDGRNFWVTVVGLYSDYPDDVLAWCRERFSRDNCIAKIVSTWRAIPGTTKMN